MRGPLALGPCCIAPGAPAIITALALVQDYFDQGFFKQALGPKGAH